MTIGQHGAMAAITVRDVPDEVRHELAARAARVGCSLEEYVRDRLVELASWPSTDDAITRARDRVRVTGTLLSAADIVAARDEDRR